MARLSFTSLYRPGSTAADGSVQMARRSLDFLIDGASLYTKLDAQRYDLIGLLGWSTFESDRRSIQQLLLDVPTALPDDRQNVFVCAECGDVGCGAITARIARHDDLYSWSDFAYESSDEPGWPLLGSFSRIGPFTFVASEYRMALLNQLPRDF